MWCLGIAKVWDFKLPALRLTYKLRNQVWEMQVFWTSIYQPFWGHNHSLNVHLSTSWWSCPSVNCGCIWGQTSDGLVYSFYSPSFQSRDICGVYHSWGSPLCYRFCLLYYFMPPRKNQAHSHLHTQEWHCHLIGPFTHPLCGTYSFSPGKAELKFHASETPARGFFSPNPPDAFFVSLF